MQKCTIKEDDIWQIFVQLCSAIYYIHVEKHIVHRDLSPANIMISSNNIIKLIDFGLAKTLENDVKVMQSVVGTIAYSCPEILQGQGYTEKADLWSIGCILYELMMLKPPFSAGNPLTVAKKVRLSYSRIR